MLESARTTTDCCIAGGGPAGIMLGLLLARQGVNVMVLEKHDDFLRDFRGDTVHPSTLEVMHELGLLEGLLQRPHQKLRELGGEIAGRQLMLADFTHLPTHAAYIALMPQWDFLRFLADEAQKLPNFRLMMGAEVTDLVQKGARTLGVHARNAEGDFKVCARLVVAADGRGSRLRARAGLVTEDLGAPIDVLWLRLSRREEDGEQLLGHVKAGRLLVLLNRGTYWQCAFIIRKGAREAWRRYPIERLRHEVARTAPFLADRVSELQSWDDVESLSVRVDRLKDWASEGLLCIGDAAHAMSPIGGVGINLAIQDAVATARLLGPALRQGSPSLGELRQVQRRRELPTRLTQTLQIAVQNRFIARVLGGSQRGAPLLARLLDASQLARRVSARIIGLGFLPEHVGSA
jgi:2-polyprenyl-6-methoxyphenol hydroxylase-like FAD-dependent oxidoreductase